MVAHPTSRLVTRQCQIRPTSGQLRDLQQVTLRVSISPSVNQAARAPTQSLWKLRELLWARDTE